MLPEKLTDSFPGEGGKQNEAYDVNEEVDAYYERTRTDKSRFADEVAHEVIKKMPNKPLRPSVHSREEQEWFNNLRSSGVTVLSDGFLEVTRWDTSGGRSTRIKQKVDGINSAIRMQDHILGGYDVEGEQEKGEFAQLESIQEVIERANELLVDWEGATVPEKAELQKDISAVVLQLENCRNEFKVGTREHAEKVAKFKDSLERENPGALAARTIGALNNLAKRFNQLQAIMPSIALRKEILMLEKRRMEYHTKKATTQLNVALSHVFFSSSSRKKPEDNLRPDEVKHLDKQLGRALYQLDKVIIAPYKQQADQARHALRYDAKKFMTSKKRLLEHRDDVQKALEGARDILNSDMSKFG